MEAGGPRAGSKERTMILPGKSVLPLAFTVLTACSPQAQDVRARLTDRPWALISVQNAEAIAEKPATLAFDRDGRMSGTGGCNRLNAAYRLAANGQSFRVDGVESTRMMCDGAVMRQERALIAALQSADSVRIDSDGRLIVAQGTTNLAVLK
jgi:heat shock protein HslJ